ncbi:MAG: sporulation integral membrane protein YtvI [Clostridia bacterium]|nr:sporulation integral membrane protein YtvI [Clostridia bacterium]
MEEFFERLNEFHKKYSRYFLMLLLIAVVLLAFRVLPYLIVLFMPFVIGWIVSLVASPMVKFLKKKLHVSYRISAVFTVLLLLTLLSLLIVMIISLVSDASGYIIENWESIINAATEYFNSAYKGLVRWSDSLPFDFMEMLKINSPNAPGSYDVGRDFDKLGSELIAQITNLLKPFAGNVATGTLSVVKSLPEAIIFIVMVMLSTYFFTSGKGRRALWYQNNLSEEFRAKMHLVKTECFGALLGTLKAQMILTFITAILLFIGFLVMGIRNAALLSIIVAVVDLLPILGVGTVLIPWSLINLLAGGSIFITIGMLVLYLICLSVRNIIQPKVLGESIGIGALATLVSIWVGYKFYGFIGMLVMPVVATLLYKFYEVGLFDWFFLSHKSKASENNDDGKEEGGESK